MQRTPNPQPSFFSVNMSTGLWISRPHSLPEKERCSNSHNYEHCFRIRYQSLFRALPDSYSNTRRKLDVKRTTAYRHLHPLLSAVPNRMLVYIRLWKSLSNKYFYLHDCEHRFRIRYQRRINASSCTITSIDSGFVTRDKRWTGHKKEPQHHGCYTTTTDEKFWCRWRWYSQA